MRYLHLCAMTALAFACVPDIGAAQTAAVDTGAVGEDSFTSENAVLDTSIPFAIGAREARQELRGAFGWPTFQEGMVEGVYFRFDPDGYARFAPTPRLDTDIFEVVCRPRTLSCMARKDALTVFLNGRGQLELRIDQITEGDALFLAEGVSEIQLPEQVLMPLTTQLETLLSSGGELVVRRENDEVARVSLTGFSAATAYLRWVAARQDYTVLPRGWPVPNAVGLAESGGLTQPQSWASPMPQPQSPFGTSDALASSQMAEVRGELNVLRDLLVQRSAPGQSASLPAEAGMGMRPAMDPSQTDIALLSQRVMELRRQIEIDRMNEIGLPQTPPSVPSLIQAAEPADEPSGEDSVQEEEPENETDEGDADAEGEATAESEADRIAHQIAYLMTEIGLDAQTAVMLLQMRDRTAPAPEVSPEEKTVARILDELGLRPDPAANIPVGVLPATPLSPPQRIPGAGHPAYTTAEPGSQTAPQPYPGTQYPADATYPPGPAAMPGQPYGAAPVGPAPQAYGMSFREQVPGMAQGKGQGSMERAAPAQPATPAPDVHNDYMLLTDYFRSVFSGN